MPKLEADIDVVAINNDEEAQKLRFPGSPMIRVDAKTLEHFFHPLR